MAHLVPSYATGGLDPDEMTEVRRHLRHCARCRRLASEYRIAFNSLGLTVPMVEPPAYLRDRILAALPQQPPFRLPVPVRFILDHPRGVIAASLAILMLFAGSIWLNVSGIHLPGSASAPITAQLDPTTVAGGILTVLNGTKAAPRARAIIAVGSDRTSAVLYAFGLPEPPEGRVYKLWLSKNGRHRNGGIIRVTPEGHAIHFIRLPEPISEFATFGITLEPASGGNEGPSGDKILEDESAESHGIPDVDTSGAENMQTSMYGIVPE